VRQIDGGLEPAGVINSGRTQREQEGLIVFHEVNGELDDVSSGTVGDSTGVLVRIHGIRQDRGNQVDHGDLIPGVRTGEVDGGASVCPGSVLEILLVRVVIEVGGIQKIDLLDVRSGTTDTGTVHVAVVERCLRMVVVHEDRSLVGETGDLVERAG